MNYFWQAGVYPLIRMIMMRGGAILLLVLVAGCQSAPRNQSEGVTDPELQKLTAELHSAETQADMNLASAKIATFWDAKLAAVEKQVEAQLDAEQQKQFTKAKTLWRNYRTEEVGFHSDFFAGGSIRPLVANETCAQITADRVAELQSVLMDTLNGGR